MKEPSIYDYLISLFDSKRTVDIQDYFTNSKPDPPDIKKNGGTLFTPQADNWKIITGVVLAVGGQILLEPSFLQIGIAIFLYLISSILIWNGLKSHQFFPQLNFPNDQKEFCLVTRGSILIISVTLLFISFILFSGNTFNWINLVFWVLGIFFMIFSFWKPAVIKKKIPRPVDIHFAIVLIIAACIVLFFRIYLLNEVPREMFSDHAEKLLDVMDVLRGKFSIFFERNTGREPIQFYFTALIIKIFNIKMNYFSLKIGTVIFGLMTLPYIYLIANDLTNKWGGFFAFFFAGIGYWPNVISRVGLRYSLYPLFTAPVIYFLLKGLKEKNINHLIVSGIFLGLGLNGYSSFRFVPFLIIVIFILYYLFNKKSNDRVQLLSGIPLIGLVSFSFFLPLFRYWFDHPSSFSYRVLSRLTQAERPFEEPTVLLFMKNFWRSIIMPFYQNGQIWVHSIPNRPALDFISAGFFFVGLIFMIHQIKNLKKWDFAVLIISIPLLMMPSILSLAYPGENPSLNRSAGALVPIFVVIGIGLYVFFRSIADVFSEKYGKWISILLGLTLITFSMINNYQLVFKIYRQQYDRNAWNSSEIGGVIKNFIQAGNSADSAFVIPFPHWVDTRLVGFNADYPGKDYAIAKSAISESVNLPGDKIYIYKPEDIEAQGELEQRFPNGQSAIFYSQVPDKDFIIYTVKE